jgi:hypothetical protein
MINNPAKYNIIPGAKLAAAGTSTHGWGTCVDISSLKANNWAISNAKAFGFVRDRYPASSFEYNHWHFVGPLEIAGSTTPPASSITNEDDTMTLILYRPASGGQAFYILTNFSLTPVSDAAHVTTEGFMNGGQYWSVDDAGFAALQAVVANNVAAIKA